MFEIDTPGEIFLRLFGVESHRNIHSSDVGRLEENVDTRRKRSWQAHHFYYKTGAKLLLFFVCLLIQIPRDSVSMVSCRTSNTFIRFSGRWALSNSFILSFRCTIMQLLITQILFCDVYLLYERQRQLFYVRSPKWKIRVRLLQHAISIRHLFHHAISYCLPIASCFLHIINTIRSADHSNGI